MHSRSGHNFLHTIAAYLQPLKMVEGGNEKSAWFKLLVHQMNLCMCPRRPLHVLVCFHQDGVLVITYTTQ